MASKQLDQFNVWTTCFEQIKDLFVKGIRQNRYFHFPS